MSAETYADLLLEWEESRNRAVAEPSGANGHCGDESILLESAPCSVEQREVGLKAQADSAWEIRLTCANGPLKGQHWSFTNCFRIGRLDSVDLRLIEPEGSVSVSRLHAIIWHDAHHWQLADLGSTNGTSLNGEKIHQQPAPLKPFDLIQCGGVCLRVESLHTPAAPSAAALLSDAPWASTEGITLPHFGRFRIGEPDQYKSLTVFPLFSDDNPAVEYLLSDEAIEAGVLTVAEVSQQGSVPELSVTNTGNSRVLFLEGEELRGAKQNRILNTSVLVPARSFLKIPVSCVEQGRWQHTSASFQSSKTVCPARLRRILKTTVTRSLEHQRGHSSDQHTIWDDVRTQHDSLGVTSTTISLEDTCFMYEHQIAEGRQQLQYVERCCGLVVAIGSQFVSADLFNNPDTCRKVWPRLLSGLMLDDLLNRNSGERPDRGQMCQCLHELQPAHWTQVQATGEGEEYRAAWNGQVASALQFQGALVHGSVVCESAR